MNKLFENWRKFRKGSLTENWPDEYPSDPRAGEKSFKVIKTLKDKIYLDIWNYAVVSAKDRWPVTSLAFDAHKHILASALYTKKYGKSIANIAGTGREMVSPSGVEMDIANNEIGYEIGEKYSNFPDDMIDRIVEREIKKGNFYVRDGKTMWKNANPQEKK